MRLSDLIARAAAGVVSLTLIACADPAEPEPEGTPRYVGLWATTVDGCAEPAWRFDANRISTQGEVSCEFQNVRMTDSGYDIDATCVAQAPPVHHNIQISFAESAPAMMVTGGPWAPAPRLFYCRSL